MLDDNTISHFDDKINYNPVNAQNALLCLKQLQEYENTPNFGELRYESPKDFKNKRYDEPEYYNEIDSTFYTDVATTTLAYTMKIFAKMGDTYSENVKKYLEDYFTEGTHDLVNDSSGEYSIFNGDSTLFDANLDIADSLYAYYNEYQLVTGDEEKKINDYTYLDGDIPKIVLKKTTDINGVDMDFYYVGDSICDFSAQLLQHDYNVTFLAERIPGEILELPIIKTGTNDIVTVTEDIYNVMNKDKGWAGYNNILNGHIVVREDYFTDVIFHEFGHSFDRLNQDFSNDYNNNNTGTWDKLTEKYADDIYTIRKGADISAGYKADGMREKHNEFYAEAFQLYFYSPETRAALPKEVRETIEEELSLRVEQTGR